MIANSIPAKMTANSLAQRVAKGWNTASAGTALNLTGYNLFWDCVPSDPTKLGWETFASQPGKDLYAYNGISYQDQVGNVIYMAPGSPGASNWTGTSPFTFSNSGLSVTMAYDNANTRWQSGVVTTRNSFGNGNQLTYGYLEMTVTCPTPSGAFKPVTSAWAKLSTAYSTPTIWDEIDIFESYIASSFDPTLVQTTFHRWPGTTPTVAGDVTAHAGISTQWTGTILNNQPYRWGLMKTPQWFIAYSNVSGSMVEIGRFPVLSQQDQVPMYGLFSLFQYFDTSALSTLLTYTATLNRIQMYTA